MEGVGVWVWKNNPRKGLVLLDRTEHVGEDSSRNNAVAKGGPYPEAHIHKPLGVACVHVIIYAYQDGG